MPLINWAAIDWVSLVAFGSRTFGAIVTAVLFAIGFAVWSYGLDDAVNRAVAMVSSGQQGG